jgi:biotin carboxylase
VIDGMATNLPLLRALFASEEVRAGRYDTRWLGQFLQGWRG